MLYFYLYIYYMMYNSLIYIYIIMLCSIIYIIYTWSTFSWNLEQCRSCLLHKRLISKEKGKRNSKSNLNLTQWLVSLKLERRERKKLRIKQRSQYRTRSYISLVNSTIYFGYRCTVLSLPLFYIVNIYKYIHTQNLYLP